MKTTTLMIPSNFMKSSNYLFCFNYFDRNKNFKPCFQNRKLDCSLTCHFLSILMQKNYMKTKSIKINIFSLTCKMHH